MGLWVPVMLVGLGFGLVLLVLVSSSVNLRISPSHYKTHGICTIAAGAVHHG